MKLNPKNDNQLTRLRPVDRNMSSPKVEKNIFLREQRESKREGGEASSTLRRLENACRPQLVEGVSTLLLIFSTVVEMGASEEEFLERSEFLEHGGEEEILSTFEGKESSSSPTTS